MASSAVAGAISAGGRQAVCEAVRARFRCRRRSIPIVEAAAHLVEARVGHNPAQTWGRGLNFSSCAKVGVASMFDGTGPAAGRFLRSLAAARTAWPPPGPRASLWEPRIFRLGPLVSMERVRTSRPASETYPACLERVRAGGPSLDGAMGHRKRLPKTMPPQQ